MTVQRGFTLIEMAIVLVIITILIGGLAMPLSAQIQARRIAETNKTLEEAREAIIGYTMSNAVTGTCACKYVDGAFNLTDCPSTVSCPAIAPPLPVGYTTLTLTIPTRHYLPCPDKPDDGDPATTDDGDGIEDRDAGGICSQSPGYLPWVTLGTANQDAWGNRLQYAVTAAFGDLSTGFSNADLGDLEICNVSANTGTSDCDEGNVARKVPVVLFSYGPNGWGARSVNNTTLADPTSNNEKENANTNHVDNEFVSRAPSDDFDDLMRWISADQLRGRVCPAGGCP